ncbi:hypothetical protein SY27_10125 [Flavobacterium sp. 316]|nr:hypothetical protein SY27_10125 [Flavobacterium sp. 316]
MVRKNYFSRLLFAGLLFSMSNSFGQTEMERKQITNEYNVQQITKMSNSFLEKEKANKKAAIEFAKSNNIPIYVNLKDGGYAELQRVDADGSLIYYSTFNVAAAKSTRANHLHSGGSLGLNLNGQNMIAYVWDGGHARVTHQEYDGAGGSNRVSVEDAASEGGTQLNFHAAHVTGTIAASGVVANAKGMAPQSRVRGYMWNNDLSEATSAAANGMLISNHSYGFRSDLVPDYYFGAYINDSRDWDNLMYNAPNYLMVVAAGNDGGTNYNSQPLNSSFPQYDKLTGHSTSKNNLVVANAQDANIDSSGNLISVSINGGSSQGPTDDLRIKPDITGNGTSVYSTYQNSDTAYQSISGTSMASPNVAGTLLLLQQHYNNINGSFMRSATLKGVAMHTADDAGSNGPDAIYGWGLLNAKRAAQAISQNGNQSIVSQRTLQPGQSYSVTVNSDGINDLLASISWTDPAGTATTATNSSTAKLVNDLDIRITKSGTTYFPWRLTGVNTNGLGDNVKDNFERIDVSNASGQYTITVTHKGSSLSGGSQNYTLIVTGITNTSTVCNATTPLNLNNSNTTSSSTSLSWSSVVGATYEVRYKTTTSSTWTTVASASNGLVLTGLSSSTDYEAQVRSICPDSGTSAYSASKLFSTLGGSTVTYCTSKGNSVADEFIDFVGLNNVSNSTGANGGYGDFTSLVANLPYGSNTINFSAGFTGSSYNEYWSVWIDYNKNGTFESSERVVNGSSTSSGTLYSTFTVPSTALSGNTRMRIQMKYNSNSTACETFSYGEVEDYTVNIGGSAALNFVNTNEELGNNSGNYDFNLFPNPVQNMLNINVYDNRAVTFSIYNLVGQKVKSGNNIESGIDVSKLSSGMYIVEVNDGQKTISKKFVKE